MARLLLRLVHCTAGRLALPHRELFAAELVLFVPTAARALTLRWMPPSLVTYMVWLVVPLYDGWNQMPCWSACAYCASTPFVNHQ